jgi:hypothetical protein
VLPARILSSTNNKPEAIVCLISDEVETNQSWMQASGGLLDLTWCD